MLDFTSRLGRRVRRRLEREHVVWLTTVDRRGRPQPRPVWFHWDGRTALIFSEPDAAKLRHIARNHQVALHFNTDEDGGDVAVLLGEASVARRRPPAARVEAYLRKYRQGLKDLGMTREAFLTSYRVPVLVRPRSLRGF